MSAKRLERNEKGFAFAEFVGGAHDCEKTKLWVHGSLAGDTLQFPVNSAVIAKTAKGNLVLRPEQNATVYLVKIESGYRGWAVIDEITNGDIVAAGVEYHSGQGSLGGTAWALVNGKGSIEIHGERSGRRVTEKAVHLVMHSDGRIEEAAEAELEQIL